MKLDDIYTSYSLRIRIDLYLYALRLCVDKLYLMNLDLGDGFDLIEDVIRSLESNNLNEADRLLKILRVSRTLHNYAQLVQDYVEGISANIYYVRYVNDNLYHHLSIMRSWTWVINACDDPIIHQRLYGPTTYFYEEVLNRREGIAQAMNLAHKFLLCL